MEILELRARINEIFCLRYITETKKSMVSHKFAIGLGQRKHTVTIIKAHCLNVCVCVAELNTTLPWPGAFALCIKFIDKNRTVANGHILYLKLRFELKIVLEKYKTQTSIINL